MLGKADNRHAVIPLDRIQVPLLNLDRQKAMANRAGDARTGHTGQATPAQWRNELRVMTKYVKKIHVVQAKNSWQRTRAKQYGDLLAETLKSPRPSGLIIAQCLNKCDLGMMAAQSQTLRPILLNSDPDALLKSGRPGAPSSWSEHAELSNRRDGYRMRIALEKSLAGKAAGYAKHGGATPESFGLTPEEAGRAFADRLKGRFSMLSPEEKAQAREFLKGQALTGAKYRWLDRAVQELELRAETGTRDAATARKALAENLK